MQSVDRKSSEFPETYSTPLNMSSKTPACHRLSLDTALVFPKIVPNEASGSTYKPVPSLVYSFGVSRGGHISKETLSPIF